MTAAAGVFVLAVTVAGLVVLVVLLLRSFRKGITELRCEVHALSDSLLEVARSHDRAVSNLTDLAKLALAGSLDVLTSPTDDA